MVTTATNLGLDSMTGQYRVLIKSDKVKGECVIRDFDDKNEAKKFINEVNLEGLAGQPKEDCFECRCQEGFAPKQKPLPDYKPKAIRLLPKGIKVGCDMPEDGGITGRVGKEDMRPEFLKGIFTIPSLH